MLANELKSALTSLTHSMTSRTGGQPGHNKMRGCQGQLQGSKHHWAVQNAILYILVARENGLVRGF